MHCNCGVVARSRSFITCCLPPTICKDDEKWPLRCAPPPLSRKSAPSFRQFHSRGGIHSCKCRPHYKCLSVCQSQEIFGLAPSLIGPSGTRYTAANILYNCICSSYSFFRYISNVRCVVNCFGNRLTSHLSQAANRGAYGTFLQKPLTKSL